jgi:HK97 gp10 family phage protein
VSHAAAVADLTGLAENLNRAAAEADTSVERVMLHIAEMIAEEMKRLAPVDTGKLRDSIRIKTMPGRIEIGPDGVDYAVYLEFGTGSRGEFPTGPYEIHPKKPDGVLVFQINDKTVHARMVIHPGIAPHPFARPALQKWLDQLGEDVAKVGVEMIVGRPLNG